MTDKDHKFEFAKAIEGLGVIYGKEITDVLLRVYWDVLKDVPIEQFKSAVAAHIALEKWFPKPCELRGPGETAIAMRAWDSAITACQQYGSYRTVDFEDHAVNATIRYLGGWARFCSMSDAVEDFWRKDFLRAYQQMRRHGVTESQAQPLPGLPGRKPPVKIGAPKIAGVEHLVVEDRPTLKAIEETHKKEGSYVQLKTLEDI
jgi:hypothetical protein